MSFNKPYLKTKNQQMGHIDPLDNMKYFPSKVKEQLKERGLESPQEVANAIMEGELNPLDLHGVGSSRAKTMIEHFHRANYIEFYEDESVKELLNMFRRWKDE